MTKDAYIDRFIQLPHDILSSILAELPVLDLYQCIFTCHSWYNTILNSSGIVSGEQCKAVVYCNPIYDPRYLGELGLYSLFSRPPPVVVIRTQGSREDRVFHHLSLISSKAPHLKVLEFDGTNIIDANQLAQRLKEFSKLERISFKRQRRNFPLAPIITACPMLRSLQYSLDDRTKVQCWNPQFQSLVHEDMLQQSRVTHLYLRGHPRTCCPTYFQLDPILLCSPNLQHLDISNEWACHMNDEFFDRLLKMCPMLQSIICFQPSAAPSKSMLFKEKECQHGEGLREFGFYRHWGPHAASISRVVTKHQHSLQSLVLDSKDFVWIADDVDDDVIKRRIRTADAWIQNIKTPRLVNLKCIDVDVSGPVLHQWLLNSTALEHVTLGGKQLTEHAFGALGRMPHLLHLHLIESYASPPPDTSLLPYICLWNNLQSLSLDCASFVTDKTLPAIASLPNLRALEINQWMVSEAGIIRFISGLKETSVVSRLKLQGIGSMNERALSMLGNVVSLTELMIIGCIVNAAGMRILIDKKKQVIKSLRVYSSKQQRSKDGDGCIRHGTVHLGYRFKWVY